MTELKRLAKNCEYWELTNSIIKDRIVEGIDSDSTRARLLREKDLSLERCVEICKAAEVADKHMKTLTEQPRKTEDIVAVIKGMKVTFARHGIPDVVHSDNGPCYRSQEFADFKNKWGFKHVTSSPHFPSSNELVEKAVQTVKNIITKSIESGHS